MLKLFCHLAQAVHSIFHKAGPDIEKALDPVLVFIPEAPNRFELMERRYFEHFDRTSTCKSAKYAGWLSFKGWGNYCAYFKKNAKLDRKPML